MKFEINPQSEAYPFGPFLWRTRLPFSIIEQLKKDGDEVANPTNNFNTALAGHIEGQYRYNDKTQYWFYTDCQSVFDEYFKRMYKHYGEEPKDPQIEPTNMWINYMKKGDYNPPHVHDGQLSYVIFVDVPEELQKEGSDYPGRGARPGSLQFIHGEVSNWSISNYMIVPQTGDMFIFPAQLRHFVAPYKSDVTRISVSGNLKVTNFLDDDKI